MPFLSMRCPWRHGLVIVLLFFCAACTRTPPEEAIRAEVAAIQSALAEHDNGGVRARLAADFQGGSSEAPTRLDPAGVRRLLAGYFLRYPHIGVVVTGLTVTPLAHDPTQAWSEASVLLTGAEGLIPETGRIYHVRGLWRQTEGDWRLVRLTWE
ncbi:hypothetical protein G3580_17280 [Nitrogeniibacter mangrovi]|uniref:DUF4440 domain-containing protein n=1 Tax=Nitrogeniibacter mangrovi TaxID=2016596 RepID=A0A6C1B654_9RHOO|nr:hypothetical protein [Nitrogeniibacter mangrovi]QID19216.1 hypothetical protein G3580_17280 [Nitrogeniibacter mangrovi]